MKNSVNQLEMLTAAESVLPGGFLGVNVKTNELTFVSNGFTALVGYTLEALQGFKNNWAQAIFHQQDETKFDLDMKQGFSNSTKATSETRILCRDGNTIWADVHAGVVENEGQDKQIYFYFVNNTKRRREMLSAENSRREMDMLLKNVPGGVAKVIIDKDFNIVFASDGFYGLAQYSKEEFNGVPILSRGTYIMHKDDIGRVKAQIDGQVKNGELLYAEFRIKKKDGSIAWLEANGSVVENNMGIVQAQVIFTDTTAAKRSSRRLLKLINSVPGGVVQLSMIGEGVNVDYASDGFYRILGYTKEEFNSLGLGKNCAPLFLPQDWQALRKKINSFFTSDRRAAEIEYRIIDRDEEIRWINIKGLRREADLGRKSMECVLTDVTIMHKSLERLRQSDERYRFISEQMNEVIVEWDLVTGNIYHSKAFERRFGYTLPEKDTCHELLTGDYVYIDDLPLIKKVMEDVIGGIEYTEAEYRIKDASGVYQWCAIHLTNVFDEDGKPFKAIGIIIDAENIKKHTAQMEEKMQLDPLTSAYNPVATRGHITDSLRRRKPEHASAMFAVDIDDFKKVNDTYGHLMGDAVLLQLTQRVRALIRAGDIFGRVGGDEFVVFIPNDMPLSCAQQKATSFLEAMNRPVCLKDMECSAHISVGISLCPTSGDTYDELYEKADKALYCAKKNGRNTYAIFEE